MEKIADDISRKLQGVPVAVTGATGMLGSELVRALLGCGAKVRVVARSASRLDTHFTPEEKAQLGIVETELTNPIELAEAFQGMEIVYNCAARVSFRFDEIEEIVRTNTDIAHHVVDACLKSGVGKLVHVSSIAALGNPGDDGLIDEKSYPDNLTGWNGYSISKYYSENEVWRGIRSGLKAVIVNPSVILGPGDWNGSGSAALFATFARGIPFYTTGVTGYVDVCDVVRAMIILSVTPSAAGRRFVLSAENLSYKDFITKTALSVGERPPRFNAGRGLLQTVKTLASIWAKLTGTEPKLTDGLIKTALTQSYYSGKNIETETGFRYTPIDDTIRRMADHYLNETKNGKQ